MKEWQKFLLYVGTFLAAYLVPFSNPKVEAALLESFKMLGDYAREHVLGLLPFLYLRTLCLNTLAVRQKSGCLIR